jgi:hypothetical protein
MKWYYRRGVILILLFFVLGPFGLPLLFKSPAFSRKGKIILTILVLVYTIVVLKYVYSWVKLSYTIINESIKELTTQ